MFTCFNCTVFCYSQVGDPKDTVRNGVKALFKQICVVYSVTKLFGYLMEGLKSKNARQRAGKFFFVINFIHRNI